MAGRPPRPTPSPPSPSPAGKVQYGLTFPNRKLPGLPAAVRPAARPLAVFGGDDDEDELEEAKLDPRELVNRRLQAEAAKYAKMAEADETMKQALEEDPTIFDYDGVYDQIHQQRQAQSGLSARPTPAGTPSGRPKYMANLIQMAKERKVEMERAVLRKIQRERAQDTENFGDKEEFVTPAYMQKLLEDQKVAEAEKRQMEAEDVTKKKDMSGFYANLLKDNVAFGTAAAAPMPKPNAAAVATAPALAPVSVPAPAPAATAAAPPAVAPAAADETAPAPALAPAPAEPAEDKQAKALSAKERYLARKAAAVAAAAAAGPPPDDE